MNQKPNIIIHSGWDCPTCGKHLPSGIVGIAKHWADCGGKNFHKELQEKIKDPDFGIEELKKLQNKDLP